MELRLPFLSLTRAHSFRKGEGIEPSALRGKKAERSPSARCLNSPLPGWVTQARFKITAGLSFLVSTVQVTIISTL